MRYFIFFIVLMLLPCAVISQTLIEAIRTGDIELAKQLARKDSVNQVDENGASALMWAVYKGDLELVTLLHDNGSTTDIKGIIYLVLS